MSKSRIGAISYYVTNIEKTEAFYRDVLGLPVQRMGDDGSGNDWLMASIEQNVDLVFFKGECRPGNTPQIVFELADGGIDDVVEGLAAKGATIVTPVSEAPGGWTADLSDPDGHTVSLYQSEAQSRRRG